MLGSLDKKIDTRKIARVKKKIEGITLFCQKMINVIRILEARQIVYF